MTKQANITPPVNPEPCRTTGACVSWLHFASISQPPFLSSFQLFFPKERQKRNLQLSFSRNGLWSSTWLRQSLTDGSQFSGLGYSCLRIMLFGLHGVKSVPGSGVSQVKTGPKIWSWVNTRLVHPPWAGRPAQTEEQPIKNRGSFLFRVAGGAEVRGTQRNNFMAPRMAPPCTCVSVFSY